MIVVSELGCFGSDEPESKKKTEALGCPKRNSAQKEQSEALSDLEWAQAALKTLDKLSATIKNEILAGIWKELISVDLNDKQLGLVDLVHGLLPYSPSGMLLRLK